MTVALRKAIRGAEGSTHPPAWVRSLVGAAVERPWLIGRNGTGADLRIIERGEFALTSLRVNDAAALSADAFRRCTVDVYLRLGSALSQLKAAHAIRLWNFIPGILDPLGDLPHRYMVFNQGRFAAYEQWHAERSDFFGRIATASGVGHGGEALEIHCLSSTCAGVPVENPRQISAYCYSRRYGPLPPCFARATLLNGRAAGDRPLLLIGGTASVVGERSAHPLRMDRQLRETFRNLRSLIAAALNQRGAGGPPPAGDPLECLEHIRIYCVRSDDRNSIESLAREIAPAVKNVEILRADLCRPELLVEIEGLAGLSSGRLNSRTDPRPLNGIAATESDL